MFPSPLGGEGSGVRARTCASRSTNRNSERFHTRARIGKIPPSRSGDCGTACEIESSKDSSSAVKAASGPTSLISSAWMPNSSSKSTGPCTSLRSAVNKDLERQHWLENEGYRVLRFADRDSRDDIERVLKRIAAELVALGPSPLAPPPQGERGS